MATKLSQALPVNDGLAANSPGRTSISPLAVLAWGRIPSHIKTDILTALEQAPPDGDADTNIFNIGAQVFKVRTMGSGFRVVYEPGDNCNTIVSVLTPREARLARG